MSQIFYSQVDPKLQEELNERALSGRRRTSKDIAFMTEKIANIEIKAFEPAPSDSKRIHGDIINKQLARLGGKSVRFGRYTPSGKFGFLNSSQAQYERTNIIINENADGTLTAATSSIQQTDNSRRIAPYIKVADFNIGDGSMGLLNKANLSLSIPNPDRDLDEFESVWLRPGRYVQITVQHPESATISEGLLSDLVLPDEDKLKEMYPEWTDLQQLKDKIRKMNEYTFSGLITSFDLSYDADASVSVTLQLTGTSDIYTDVTMFMNPDKKKENDFKSKYAKISTSGSAEELRNVNTTPSTSGSEARVELYDTLSNAVDAVRNSYLQTIIAGLSPLDAVSLLTYGQAGIAPFLTNSNFNDRFVMFGRPYYEDLDRQFIAENTDPRPYTASAAYKIDQSPDPEAAKYNISGEPFNERLWLADVAEFESGSLADKNQWDKKENARIEEDIKRQEQQYEEEEKLYDELINDNRYITLGALIKFLNDEILFKQGNTTGEGVLCDDVLIESTHYEHLRSLDPESVFFLPKNPAGDLQSPIIQGGINWYGKIGYYEDVIVNQTKYSGKLQQAGLYGEWKGVIDENSSSQGTMYPSRIFINLESIKKIIDDLSNFNARRFTFGAFIEKITALLRSATGGALEMTLTPHPDIPEAVLYADAESVKLQEIRPYKIPMFANDPRGTIVRDFQFSAKLPNSVKNLSYVLNQGTDISTEKIAPYMNFMFNADNVDTMNTIIKNYETTHFKAVTELHLAQQAYGLEPQDSDRRKELRSATAEYLKYPTPDVRKSQQLTAPIFPFDASFTIDGINGFRYGDVLEFSGLPKKYTVNTVFSIIGINHTVSSEGAWTTKITCIMRPNIS
tara:strand:+ start:10178 stop:12733 length:2556 start_codon:yes stop_codon:yes gene_type:complete